MNQRELIEAVREYDAKLRAIGASALFVFGSRARGTARPDSDLDLFIDFDPARQIPSLLRLMEIEEEMSRALGMRVTITTRDALHPLMRAGIEREAVRVA